MQESSANAYVPELDETPADDFWSTPINRHSQDPSAGLEQASDNLHDAVAGLIAPSACERPLMLNGGARRHCENEKRLWERAAKIRAEQTEKNATNKFEKSN